MSLPGRPKYRNTKVEVDGLAFHSKREAKRWQELRLLEAAGQISLLGRQTPFQFPIDGVPMRYVNNNRQGRIVTYVADFTYVDGLGRAVVEDAKGFPTPDYKLKRALMLAVHGIRVIEI